MSRPLDAVTFDYWDTLVAARPADFRRRRIETWLAALEESALPHTYEQLDACFGRVVDEFNRRWAANAQFTALDAAAWAIADLGLAPGKQLRAALEGAFTWSGDDLLPDPAPGVADVLEALRAAGVRVGIICDVGLTPSTSLRRYLAAHDLLDAFDHWSFSDEVGVYKPHAAIFEHALDGLGGVEPARAAHVGDLRRTDVAGARSAGMRAVRYAGLSDDAPGDDEHPEGHHVVTHHDELLEVLGLA